MSHITACASKIALKRKDWIQTAINLMADEFTGIRYEERDGMILIRYAPIEVYQTKGNMRFIPTKDKTGYEMHLDTWECGYMVEKVRKSFFTNYQRAGAMSFCQKNGYKTGSPVKTETGIRMVATQW